MDRAAEICRLLTEKQLTLATVESATGGLIAKLLTDVSGSSAYFKGSIISYSNEVKIKVVGVDSILIERHGAVSPEVAAAMAAGGRKLLGADICLSDTGIAGPGGGSDDKPVGLFYLGLASGSRTLTAKHSFSGSREENRLAAAETALAWLIDNLEQLC